MKTTLKVWAIAAMVLLPMIAWAEPTNMLADGGFEDYSHKNANIFYPERYEWEEWESTAILWTETVDVLEGATAMRFQSADANGSVQQPVSMRSEPEGEELVLTIHYKVLEANSEAQLNLKCSWELQRTYDDSHDKDILTQALPIDDGWLSATVRTTVPADASKLHVGIGFTKKTLLLLDDWSLCRAKDVPSSVESVTVEHATKQFINGQLVITHNNCSINVLGQSVY